MGALDRMLNLVFFCKSGPVRPSVAQQVHVGRMGQAHEAQAWASMPSRGCPRCRPPPRILQKPFCSEQIHKRSAPVLPHLLLTTSLYSPLLSFCVSSPFFLIFLFSLPSSDTFPLQLCFTVFKSGKIKITHILKSQQMVLTFSP